MNEDIGKFGQDSMQQEGKIKIYEKYLTENLQVKLLTCNVFIFYKNVLCRLRSSCSRHDVKNGVIKVIKVQINTKFTA